MAEESYELLQQEINRCLQNRLITYPEMFQPATTPPSFETQIIVYSGAPGAEYQEKQSSYDYRDNFQHKASPGDHSSFQHWTSRTNHVDKESCCCARSTIKEAVSTGETFKERGTGRAGFKHEHMTTSTVRTGDRSGYTEYQIEERFRRVNFGDNSSSNGYYSRPSNRNYMNWYLHHIQFL